MTPHDVLVYFGSPLKAAKALKMTRQGVYGWCKRGAVPLAAQRKVEKLTKGALKASPPPSLQPFDGSTFFYRAKTGLHKIFRLVFQADTYPRVHYFGADGGMEMVCGYGRVEIRGKRIILHPARKPNMK